MTIGSFWKMKWIFAYWKIFFRCIQRVFFFEKVKIFTKIGFQGQILKCCFCSKNLQKASFYQYIHWLNSQFLKKGYFFVLISKWYVYMVFLKWCFCMVFLYNFLGTWQQGHIEVYKQHVHMVILFDFLDLMTAVAFPDASFFR